jgi:hypothetical protein
MKEGYKCLFVFSLMAGILAVGCTSRAPYVVKEDFEKSTTKVIAVLPIDNRTPEQKASYLLRSKILDHIYFKGYTKMPPELIDRKIGSLYSSEKKGDAGFVNPQVLKELVEADAVMSCILTEGKRSVSFFYAPVTVAASCQLLSTKTGEVLWNAGYKSTSRSFEITGKRLEMKSCEDFETVMEDVVNKVMETLPDGPNLRG